MFGRPQVATAGQLNIPAAGAPDALKRVMPVLESMGQKVRPFGERPSAANLIKLSGNFMLFAVVEALAESIALVCKAGVDEHAFVDLITNTMFTAPGLQRLRAIDHEAAISNHRHLPRRWA